MTALYDRIGLNYAALRRPDPRIAARIAGALGDARRVVNVGAGTGNYEPEGRDVTAVEPSAEMIAQRPDGPAHVVQAGAEALPFADDSFDAAMAVLTVHHWSDAARGLRQMRRIATGPIAILTGDPTFRGGWLRDYFPGLVDLDARVMPPVEVFEGALGPIKVTPVPIPHDCTDGFLEGYWARPAAYLDARVRAAISPFHLIDGVEDGLAALDADLRSGEWTRRYGALLTQDTLDCGYRLIESVGT